jgi:hypothetical protein
MRRMGVVFFVGSLGLGSELESIVFCCAAFFDFLEISFLTPFFNDLFLVSLYLKAMAAPFPGEFWQFFSLQ